MRGRRAQIAGPGLGGGGDGRPAARPGGRHGWSRGGWRPLGVRWCRGGPVRARSGGHKGLALDEGLAEVSGMLCQGAGQFAESRRVLRVGGVVGLQRMVYAAKEARCDPHAPVLVGSCKRGEARPSFFLGLCGARGSGARRRVADSRGGRGGLSRGSGGGRAHSPSWVARRGHRVFDPHGRGRVGRAAIVACCGVCGSEATSTMSTSGPWLLLSSVCAVAGAAATCRWQRPSGLVAGRLHALPVRVMAPQVGAVMADC